MGETDNNTTVTAEYTYRPEQVQQLMDTFARKHRLSKVEHALVLSPDGKAYELMGDKATVDITILGEYALKGSRVSHNHPIGFDGLGDSFSRDDFKLFFECNLVSLEVASGSLRNSFTYSGEKITGEQAHDLYEQAKAAVRQKAFEDDLEIEQEQLAFMRELARTLKGLIFNEDV